MKLTEYIEHYKKQGWDDEAEKEWRELQENAKKWIAYENWFTKDDKDTATLFMDCIIEHNTIERLKKFFNGDNVLTKSEYKQKILVEKTDA